MGVIPIFSKMGSTGDLMIGHSKWIRPILHFPGKQESGGSVVQALKVREDRMCLLELIRLQTRKMKVKMSSNRVDFPLFGMCLPKVFVDSFENNSLFSTSFLHQWVAKNNALHGLILLSFVFAKLTIYK